MKAGLEGIFKGDFVDLSRRYADIFLAAGVVGIVGMMIIPLPTPILDLLLVLNITIAVSMMMISIYITGALKLSSYPTIILIPRRSIS